MIKYLSLLSISFILFSCNKAKKCGFGSKANCVCTMQYDPVCGCDKKTYGNDCLAECEGITEYTKGECK